jgi:hypothetical protein
VPQPDIDYCNPLAVFEALIQYITGTSPTAQSSPSSSVPSDAIPPVLSEPAYRVRQDSVSGRFQLGKPGYEIFDEAVLSSAPFIVIQEFTAQADADAMRVKLPPIRFPGRLQVQIIDGNSSQLPAEQQADWTNAPDAQEARRHLAETLDKIPLINSLPDQTQVSVGLARLERGTMAHFSANPADVTKGLLRVDPFQCSRGILGLAVTYIHELTHAQYFYRRKFTLPGLVPLITREDYVLIGLDEEFAAYQNEVIAVKQFLSAIPPAVAARFQDQITAAIDRPTAFYVSSATAGLAPATLDRMARQTTADTYRLQYGKEYDDAKSQPPINSPEAARWINSPEWVSIQATRNLWADF